MKLELTNKTEFCSQYATTTISRGANYTMTRDEILNMPAGREMDKKYYSIGYFAVGKPKDKSYFANVFNSFADADYFIRNMRRSIKNFHYFVEACEVKKCSKCCGSGIQRTMLVSLHPHGKELEACDNCHGHGVVKA